MKDGIVEEFCDKYTIYHKRDVVAHKHRTYKVVGIFIEYGLNLLREAVAFLVHLNKHAIACDKGYFHARKERGKHHRNEYAEYKAYTNRVVHIELRVVFLLWG